MTYERESQLTFVDVRAFYKGGVKSANKDYDPSRVSDLAKAVHIDEKAAGERVAKRDANQVESNRLIGIERKAVRGGGLKSPVEIGRERYNAKMTYGNCGEMACVAMYIATLHGVQPDAMVMATATNEKQTRGALFWSSHMTFGHSYLLMGSPAEGWTVDPWAGVLCLQSEYPAALKHKLDQWHKQGKRISVTWSNGKGVWTNANDEAILSLVGKDAVVDYWLGSKQRPT